MAVHLANLHLEHPPLPLHILVAVASEISVNTDAASSVHRVGVRVVVSADNGYIPKTAFVAFRPESALSLDYAFHVRIEVGHRLEFSALGTRIIITEEGPQLP